MPASGHARDAGRSGGEEATQRPFRITAVVGSYRKGGVVDQVVDEILAAAAAAGGKAQKVYLLDTRIEFCTNCRLCTQKEGSARGICPMADQMGCLLDLLEESDALVLASPTNFGGVTALMKRFIERLVCYAYWPWGSASPKVRKEGRRRRAVLVASGAAPALLTRFMTPVLKSLKQAAGVLGADVSGTIVVGLAARQERQGPGERARATARRLGGKLVSG